MECPTQCCLRGPCSECPPLSFCPSPSGHPSRALPRLLLLPGCCTAPNASGTAAQVLSEGQSLRTCSRGWEEKLHPNPVTRNPEVCCQTSTTRCLQPSYCCASENLAVSSLLLCRWCCLAQEPRSHRWQCCVSGAQQAAGHGLCSAPGAGGSWGLVGKALPLGWGPRQRHPPLAFSCPNDVFFAAFSASPCAV